MKLYLVAGNDRGKGGTSLRNVIRDSMKLYQVAGGCENSNHSLAGIIRDAEMVEAGMNLYLSMGNHGGAVHALHNLITRDKACPMNLYISTGCHERKHTPVALSQYHPDLRFLLSFYYLQQESVLKDMLAVQTEAREHDLFLDSGAFSAMTMGEHISLKKYARFLLTYKNYFTTYANLDVIRDAEKTRDHQIRLEKEYGLAPLPIFHVNEEWRYLDSYLERYRYIGLGVAGSPHQSYLPWLVKCFQIAGKRAVFHGFGITTWEVLQAFPWYSVDSSSWGAGVRYGRVPIFDEEHHCFQVVRLGDAKSCYAQAELLRTYGYTPEEFADRAKNDSHRVRALSLVSYKLAEMYLTKRWGEVSIPT